MLGDLIALTLKFEQPLRTQRSEDILDRQRLTIGSLFNRRKRTRPVRRDKYYNLVYNIQI